MLLLSVYKVAANANKLKFDRIQYESRAHLSAPRKALSTSFTPKLNKERAWKLAKDCEREEEGARGSRDSTFVTALLR